MAGGGVVQRQVLYLGELNDNQRTGWVRTIETFSGEKSKARQQALFPDDRKELPMLACETIRVQFDKIELRSPREWGACWLGLYVWDMLELDTFWKQRLLSSRKGTSWLNILKAIRRRRDRVVKNVLGTAGTNVRIAFKWLWHWC